MLTLPIKLVRSVNSLLFQTFLNLSEIKGYTTVNYLDYRNYLLDIVKDMEAVGFNTVDIRRQISKEMNFISYIFKLNLTVYRLTVKIMKYLVNLSNHPSAGWSDEQKNAASEYGMVVDLPFPDVDPELDSVDELAKQFVREHFSDQDRNTTVHVMGEMTFVYNVVRRLCVLGITCIASTTKRVVEEVDGKKVSQFKFVKFRKYE